MAKSAGMALARCSVLRYRELIREALGSGFSMAHVYRMLQGMGMSEHVTYQDFVKCCRGYGL